MARYDELRQKHPNFRFGGDAPYSNKKRVINNTVLIQKRTKEIGITILNWIEYLDTIKDRYPQFNKIKLAIIGPLESSMLEVVGEMLETDELYEERIKIEEERIELFTLHQERKKKIKEQEEINYYHSLYNKFGGKKPEELLLEL